MSLMKFKNRKGFTLIEMMIVIAVIAILAAVLIPKSGLVQKAAKESGVEANARVVQGVIENMLPRYDADKGDVDFRRALATKLEDKVVNPFTGVTKVEEIMDCKVTPNTGASVVISKHDPDELDTNNPINAGVVWVKITDKIGSITIYQFDKEGAKIPKTDVTVK